jgi:hypothetical protein
VLAQRGHRRALRGPRASYGVRGRDGEFQQDQGARAQHGGGRVGPRRERRRDLDENLAVACAAHCAGDLSTREDWCKYIVKQFAHFGGPYYLIVTVGSSGKVERGKVVVKEYMAKLKIPDANFRVALLNKYGGVGVTNGMLFAQEGASFEFGDEAKRSRKRKQTFLL